MERPVREKVKFSTTGESRTWQSAKDECDIKQVVKRYAPGQLPPPPGPESFFDVSSMPDLQEALELVDRANRNFLSLPARARYVYGNDPLELAAVFDAAFGGDEDAVAELVELGVLRREDSRLPAPAERSEGPTAEPSGERVTPPEGGPAESGQGS